MRVLLGLAALLLATSPGLSSAAPLDQGTPTAAQGAGTLIIQADMTIGAPGPCILQSRFSPGDRVVFRAKVFDGQTGQEVRDGTVTVRFENGNTVAMRYEAHPPPQVGPSTDEYWAGVWAIGPNTPLGVVHYSIEASSGRRTGTYVPFNYEGSMLTVVPRTD